MTFTASDVLLKAASRIEEEGMWCQEHMFSGEAACALGTLLDISQELDVNSDGPVYNLGRLLGGPDPIEAIIKWNDAPGRTAAEVAETMRRAAL